MRNRVLHIAQGEHAVADCPETMITTLLGSCVATCLWDPVAGTGGMNHILLPDGRGSEIQSQSHGTNAMELLINALLKRGADRGRLQAKLFGGARMIEGLSNIGEANAIFARDFCDREGITCIASSLGGTQGRRVQFWPASGRARQQMLRNVPELAKTETKPPEPPSTSDEVELF